MPYCINCGSEVKVDSKFCSSCGAKVFQPNEAVNEQKPKVMRCFTVFGNVGYVLGIVTLVMSFIPFFSLYAFFFGIHGIVFSALGKRDETQLDKCKKGLRRSIIGSILGVVLFVVFIVVMIALSDK